jgi:hypothetical protein
MKKLFICVFLFGFILAQANMQAQELTHSVEFGLGVGALNYTGDLSPSYRIKQSKPGAELFFKYNLPNDVSVFRFNLLMGGLGADESAFDSPLTQNRNLSFSTIITEAAFLYEYNFLNFRRVFSNNDYYMTPFLFGGLSASVGSVGGAPAYFGIPFGAGLKFMVTKGVNIGIEYGARKIFSDEIDGYDEDVELSSSSSQDWYYFTALTVSYTLYRDNCPPHLQKR